MKNKKAIFLDRDGVVNYEKNFVLTPEAMELIPEAPEAIRKINASAYLAVMITNQSAVARNLINTEELIQIHNKLKADLKASNAHLDAIYYCPHHPDYDGPGVNKDLIMDCHCRKPKPGMLTEASNELDIDLSLSYMIGDAERDILAGKEAGCTTIGVKTGKNIENFNIRPDYTFENILEAVNFILEKK
jgi:D-glycero-D-manno-heptose 1,7-bisphosphate phosphatase